MSCPRALKEEREELLRRAYAEAPVTSSMNQRTRKAQAQRGRRYWERVSEACLELDRRAGADVSSEEPF